MIKKNKFNFLLLIFHPDFLQIWIPLVGVGLLYLLSWYHGIDVKSSKNDKDSEIRKIHFKGEVVEIGKQGFTYYFVLDKQDKRLYIPHDDETQRFVKELKVGAYVRKRRYSRNVKVVYNGEKQYYKYAQNAICFRKKIENYTY